jgi:hypothetical protein
VTLLYELETLPCRKPCPKTSELADRSAASVTAPRPKPPQISPIFISDKVTLHVSREKDGKLRLVYAAWDDHMVVQPDSCGQARGVEGWILPPGRGER